MEVLATEVAAHPMVLDRLLGHVPEAVVRDWVSRATDHVEFMASGGATIPPSTAAERRGAGIARDIFEDALNGTISHGSTGGCFV